jgi:hypothetical protein
MTFPDIHSQKIRTNNPLERIMKRDPAQNPRRRCLPGRFSPASTVAARLGFHVPYKSLVEVRAVYMPDVARSVPGHPPN